MGKRRGLLVYQLILMSVVVVGAFVFQTGTAAYVFQFMIPVGAASIAQTLLMEEYSRRTICFQAGLLGLFLAGTLFPLGTAMTGGMYAAAALLLIQLVRTVWKVRKGDVSSV
ncbi:hypothetical protein [Alteribacter natronophilus]|uniref:hypothetical protein n=1 Tax=Alteribacter natronophilus TaxID=2583810 RepID=UPI00110D4195|nr:hypothetical protein [Alteribacter natronophilus]TMW71380.1 hypothetical protein FGB90_10025 [Alteribacter natronophilus]